MSTRRTTRAASKASGAESPSEMSTVTPAKRSTRRATSKSVLPPVRLRASTAYGTDGISRPPTLSRPVGQEQISDRLEAILDPPGRSSQSSAQEQNKSSRNHRDASIADRSYTEPSRIFADATIDSSSINDPSDLLPGIPDLPAPRQTRQPIVESARVTIERPLVEDIARNTRVDGFNDNYVAEPRLSRLAATLKHTLLSVMKNKALLTLLTLFLVGFLIQTARTYGLLDGSHGPFVPSWHKNSRISNIDTTEDLTNVLREMEQRLHTYEHHNEEIREIQKQLKYADSEVSVLRTSRDADRKAYSKLEDQLKHLQVRMDMERHIQKSADNGLQVTNYFSEGNGASILPAYTSSSHLFNSQRGWSWDHLMQKATFKSVALPREPIEALRKYSDAGECWCSPVDPNPTLAVRTGVKIRPTYLVIEHPLNSLEPGTSPREMELWAYIKDPLTRANLIKESVKFFGDLRDDPKLDRFVPIAVFEHTMDHAVQRFSPSLDVQSNKFLVRMRNNWGQGLVSYTCLYRVSMEGEPI